LWCGKISKGEREEKIARGNRIRSIRKFGDFLNEVNGCRSEKVDVFVLTGMFKNRKTLRENENKSGRGSVAR
jgi:hypothetical protein